MNNKGAWANFVCIRFCLGEILTSFTIRLCDLCFIQRYLAKQDSAMSRCLDIFETLVQHMNIDSKHSPFTFEFRNCSSCEVARQLWSEIQGLGLANVYKNSDDETSCLSVCAFSN